MLKPIQKRKFNPKENFSKNPCKSTDIYTIFLELGEESNRNGTSEMTLEEINAEIAAARRDMAARRA